MNSYDDEAMVNDLLASMAESLLEDYTSKQAKPPQTIIARPPPPMDSIYIRPPRDIFYRQTVTYATNNTLHIPIKRCTCRFVCNGLNAVIKCFSCVMYDTQGLGYYCQNCFDEKHPYYRVDHIFTSKYLASHLELLNPH